MGCERLWEGPFSSLRFQALVSTQAEARTLQPFLPTLTLSCCTPASPTGQVRAQRCFSRSPVPIIPVLLPLGWPGDRGGKWGRPQSGKGMTLPGGGRVAL